MGRGGGYSICLAICLQKAATFAQNLLDSSPTPSTPAPYLGRHQGIKGTQNHGMSQIDLLIGVVLGMIMFGIGASLRIKDFRSMFVDTRAFWLGITLQMIVLPLVAWAIARHSGLPPVWQMGLFVVAICPGGTTSNFVSYLVKADAALSIALTTVNSVLILLTIPLLSNWAMGYFMSDAIEAHISLRSTFLNVVTILLLPAVLGIAFNERFRRFSKRIQQPVKIINTLLLAAVFGIKFFAGREAGGSGITTTEIQHILPYALALHFITLLLSYLMAILLRFPRLQATTIGIEVGLQNTTLALLVTGTLLANNDMTKPALVFAIFSFFTTLLFAVLTSGRWKTWLRGDEL